MHTYIKINGLDMTVMIAMVNGHTEQFRIIVSFNFFNVLIVRYVFILRRLLVILFSLFSSENGRFTCAGWRLFKLPANASKRGASSVTYNGNIPSYPEAFPWDIDITFKVLYYTLHVHIL